MKEYAVYKGEEVLCMGTAEECAKQLGVKQKTIYWYSTDAYKRRLKKRKAKNYRISVPL